MKEAFIDKHLSVTIRDTEIPVPEAGQVLIRVVVSGSNPKDWKMALSWPPDGALFNQGDDIAGHIEAVGDGVLGFHKGDKVAAFHQVMKPHGSWAEYAIAPSGSTFHIPEKTSFEEASTIPLAAMTAAVGMFQRSNLPLPWKPTSEPLPYVIYGGATAVGAFTIKFAQLSNIHPLIVVAGRGSAFVETLIDRKKGDTIIDYRQGDDIIREKIKAAAGERPIHHALDAVSEKDSWLNIGPAMTAPGHLTLMMPGIHYQPEGISVTHAIVGYIHFPPSPGKTIEDTEFAAAFYQLMGRGLAQGWFSGHPYEVRPGGLAGLQGAMLDLQAGKASAVKYVVRIGETDGVEQ
ncbi:secondary metabolism biosynthetic enzyme [Penicillium waksmanii]|uniref:secondary metabolism biosynthetic enzyme n=1 Tax=Penicillium waksmanii TaxID=69791 RepID=UPI002548F3B2|nr:secondary metabolism biosynthetic enzyme [Penicillium waksmanii]KAJ5999698.1 secondary metabolism biosynthetic enzyme [Penicillium waksmanii]